MPPWPLLLGTADLTPWYLLLEKSRGPSNQSLCTSTLIMWQTRVLIMWGIRGLDAAKRPARLLAFGWCHSMKNASILASSKVQGQIWSRLATTCKEGDLAEREVKIVFRHNKSWCHVIRNAPVFWAEAHIQWAYFPSCCRRTDKWTYLCVFHV